MKLYVTANAVLLILMIVACTRGFEFRHGKTSVNHTAKTSCHQVLYTKPWHSTRIKIFLSLGYGQDFTRVHNPGALWYTAVTSRGFTLCLRGVGRKYKNTTVVVHWLAVRGYHANLEHGEVSLDKWTVGAYCKKVNLARKYYGVPKVFVTVFGRNKSPRNSAHYIWATTGTGNSSFEICLHEVVVFDGAHTGIKAVWFAFDGKKHPWNFTGQVTFDSNVQTTSSKRHNYASCKVVNFTSPFFAPPMVLLTANHHSNNISSSITTPCSAIAIWTEVVNKVSFQVCMKSSPGEDSADASVNANYIMIGDLDPCIGVRCDYFAECRAFGPHDARCVCVTDCRNYEETVCSSNGTTYRNKCFFQMEMCRLKNNHTLIHPGSCRGFPWQRGRAIITFSPYKDTACTTQEFDRYAFYPDKQVHVQLTVNHANTRDLNYVHDAMASWVEKIAHRRFDVCVAIAGHNHRARVANASVDWFAYQGAPAGGVADRTMIREWWSGTKCETVNLPKGSFNGEPTILLTAEHISEGSRHDAALLWAEDITRTSFKACLRELQNFDGLHRDIQVSWMAFEKLHRPLFAEKGVVPFPNKGIPSISSNGAFCKDLSYVHPRGHVPTIILSTNHNSSVGSVSPQCNGVSTWVEYVNTTGFRICLKELYVNKYEPLSVSYLLLFDICPRGWQYFQGLCYLTSHGCHQWTVAEFICRAVKSSHLVTVRNQDENVFIQQRLGGEKSWIGLNDRSIEGDFRWSSKMRVNWTFWASNQPNDYNSTQDCVHTQGPVHHYRWNDIDCTTCNNYTCSKDYDECSSGQHDCHEVATCSNTYGTYVCTCQTGYTGDGRNCTDVNECLLSLCHVNAACKNTKGSFVCTCNGGFTGDGLNCTDVDECATNSSSCHVNAICTNTKGSYNCTCKRGYHGNGRTCISHGGRGFQHSNILSSNINYINALNSYLSGVIKSSSTWVRCWRASTDGWASSIFHSRCDNKGSTVTIVRVGSYVFGGYSDQTWASCSSCCWRTSYRSFLFSLYNRYGYSPRKITLMRYRQYAVYSCNSYGPTFGGGHDLYISNYASSNRNSYNRGGHTYNNPGFYFAGSWNFCPNEVEVFYETT